MAIPGGVGMGWPGFKRHRWWEGSSASAPPPKLFICRIVFILVFNICRQSSSNSASLKVWGQGVGQHYVATGREPWVVS